LKPTSQEDENVMSTPMYNTDDPNIAGPYYVPWKKTSMEAHDKYFAKKIYRKNSGEYIPDSTLGNVPTNNDE